MYFYRESSVKRLQQPLCNSLTRRNAEMTVRAYGAILYPCNANTCSHFARNSFIIFPVYRSCGDCPLNETACLHNHCVTADGQRRGILTANRQLPGPTIQVSLENYDEIKSLKRQQVSGFLSGLDFRKCLRYQGYSSSEDC